jgi:hypothetical protein
MVWVLIYKVLSAEDNAESHDRLLLGLLQPRRP